MATLHALPIPARCTPVPNILLDDWMPLLSDTELRVLLVVTRQTLGFQAGGKTHNNTPGGTASRRARDWLTHARLKQATGRASEAVSKAVDGLVKRGLLEVCTECGSPLLTPPERRRCRGRIFFSLAPSLLTKA